MATITLTATSNADGTMTLAGSAGNSSSGLSIVVPQPKNESVGQWRRTLADFIVGTLYP
jgi:hypothetical protein